MTAESVRSICPLGRDGFCIVELRQAKGSPILGVGVAKCTVVASHSDKVAKEDRYSVKLHMTLERQDDVIFQVEDVPGVLLPPSIPGDVPDIEQRLATAQNSSAAVPWVSPDFQIERRFLSRTEEEVQQAALSRWRQRAPALPFKVVLVVEKTLAELGIMDLLAPHLSQRDKCSLQATCRTLRNEGLRSKVFNRSLKVAFSEESEDSSNFESFNMWLTPRAEAVRKLNLTWDIDDGELPSSMSSLTALRTLFLRAEGRITTMPTGFGYFQGLRVFKVLTEDGFSKLSSISSEIWQLTELRELEIGQHDTFEPLSPDISNLQELHRLSIGSSSCTYEIPPEIGSLTKLTYLDLPDVHIIEELWELKQLYTLILDPSDLEELPAAISQLTALEELDLSRNTDAEFFLTLSPAIGQLTRLTFLSLWSHTIESLPPEIGNLISLNALDLSHCDELNELPQEFQNLKALTWLDMRFCRKIESLPVEIGKLTALQELNLRNCSSLTSLPSTIGLLTNLSMLELDGCSNLTSLPAEVLSLRKIKSLDMSAVKRLDFS